MNKNITLRVRTRDMQFTLETKASETLKNVKQQIASKSSIPSSRQIIKCGFPPKILEVHEEKTFGELGIESGETFIVEMGPEQVKNDEQKPNNSSQSFVDVGSQQKSKNLYIPLLSKFKDIPSKPSTAMISDNQCEEGSMVRRVIPSDNSCLFSSIRYCLEGACSRGKDMSGMRNVIAEMISCNPSIYNEVVLGMKPSEYKEWIKKKESWGGAIECSIFSKVFQVQICAFDIQSTRMDVYGQDEKDYMAQIFILYDGIHYDALAFNIVGADGPEDIDTTVFSVNDSLAIAKAQSLVRELHKKRQFTDLNQFNLRCLVCGEGLRGQKDATLHASKTGHTNFAENN